MIFIVDIDETICRSVGCDYRHSMPYQERIDKVNNLYDEGHEVIYWTARGMDSGIDWTDLTEHQLKIWGCRYTRLMMNKPKYDIWIDDKSINSEDFFI